MIRGIKVGLGLSLAYDYSAPLGGDPDALAYISALTATGITVSESRNNAITTFIGSEKAAGRWNGIKRLYFPIWGTPAANAICMKSLTTGTFVGSVTHSAGYITSSDAYTGGYMNTNTSLGSVGISNNSYHFAVLHKTYDPGSDNRGAFSFGNVNTYIEYNDGAFNQVLGGVNSALTDVPLALYSINGINSSTNYNKNRTATGVTTFEAGDKSAGSFSTNNILLLANTVGGRRTLSQIGMLSLGIGMTDANDTAYTLALRTLWYNCVIGSDNPANATQPNATANVLMDGPFFSGQSWRNLTKTDYAPYGSSTTPPGGGFNYGYGDEVVRFDGGAWIYENAGTGEIARAWSTAPYPWLATNWNNNFSAAKVTPSYVKTTNYPAVP